MREKRITKESIAHYLGAQRGPVRPGIRRAGLSPFTALNLPFLSLRHTPPDRRASLRHSQTRFKWNNAELVALEIGPAGFWRPKKKVPKNRFFGFYCFIYVLE